jgi:hypothetical protein
VADEEARANSRVLLQQIVAAPIDIDREELREIYKIAIDEYRFEVTLNWQRTQHYLTLNLALVAAAVGLLKVGGTDFSFLVALLFGVGAFVATLARKAIKTGHTYYRRAAYKKTLIEHLLGRLHPIPGYKHPGANLAIATTAGMAGMTAANALLDDPDAWINRPAGRSTVTNAVLWMLLLIMVVDTLAACFCAMMATGW